MDKPVIDGNTITVPSDLKYLAAVDDFVEGILKSYGTDESTLADIAISVSELVNNAVEHGNQTAGAKVVKITVDRAGDSVRITVRVEGLGFDPNRIDDPLADENLMKEAGRGIFIVRSLMDKVDISATQGGTTVEIVKKIA